MRVKSKFHKVIVRPALIYELETAPLKKISEKKMDMAEMKILRWIVGITKRDRIRNMNIRRTVKVVEISKKIQETRLSRYEHLKRRNYKNLMEREAMEMEVQEYRKRGRHKRRCIQ